MWHGKRHNARLKEVRSHSWQRHTAGQHRGTLDNGIRHVPLRFFNPSGVDQRPTSATSVSESAVVSGKFQTAKERTWHELNETGAFT
jgi:hypothetical protein